MHTFWSRLKTERLDGQAFPNLAEAQLEISHHIAYYNTDRLHSILPTVTTRPTASNPNAKPRPNAVRLSWTNSFLATNFRLASAWYAHQSVRNRR